MLNPSNDKALRPVPSVSQADSPYPAGLHLTEHSVTLAIQDGDDVRLTSAEALPCFGEGAAIKP